MRSGGGHTARELCARRSQRTQRQRARGVRPLRPLDVMPQLAARCAAGELPLAQAPEAGSGRTPGSGGDRSGGGDRSQPAQRRQGGGRRCMRAGGTAASSACRLWWSGRAELRLGNRDPSQWNREAFNRRRQTQGLPLLTSFIIANRVQIREILTEVSTRFGLTLNSRLQNSRFSLESKLLIS